MRYKTAFRLALKAIGVLLVGWSIPNLAQMVAWVSFPPAGIGGRGPFDVFGVITMAGQLAQFAFGLYLFFGGRWVVDRCIPSNHPYCPECGYELRAETAGRCPECGTTLPEREPRVDVEERDDQHRPR